MNIQALAVYHGSVESLFSTLSWITPEHLVSPLESSLFPSMHTQACDQGQQHLGTGAYRSDALLSITALHRGWIDWLHYCGFVWVFNWLINCGPGLRCDWLWVVSSGSESGLSKPTGWEVSSCGSCNMLVLLSKNPTFISHAWYSHTLSLPRSPSLELFFLLSVFTCCLQPCMFCSCQETVQ